MGSRRARDELRRGHDLFILEPVANDLKTYRQTGRSERVDCKQAESDLKGNCQQAGRRKRGKFEGREELTLRLNSSIHSVQGNKVARWQIECRVDGESSGEDGAGIVDQVPARTIEI